MSESVLYNKLDKCPICENRELEEYLRTKDFTFSKEEFILQRCKSCGFRFTNPIPEEENIGNYYGAENYMSHATQSKKGLMPFVYKRVRNINLKRKIKQLKKHAKGNVLLDIGAGNGFFLDSAQRHGFLVHGLEPGEKARSIAKNDFGLDLKDPGEINKIESNSVDVITMWHVLEHVYHLKRDIREYTRILKEDGVLIVAVPNIDSFDARYYQEYWDGLDLPLHLYHFCPNDIRNLFDQFGMEMLEMVPMKFDSFWVSMNSEKFKGGNLIKAFFIGFKSNLVASNGKYSSQIYILKRKGA
jgi:SAM-dependent methyltransferase